MNESNLTWLESESGPSAWIVFIAYWELMVCVVGTPLNLIVIFVWINVTASRSPSRRMHTQSRNQWFILSMTCGDLLFACIHSPIMFAWYDSRLEMTDGLCLLLYGATHLSTTVSSISLLLLNIDKFIYLHWPLHYHTMMTKRRALIMTLCGWLVAFTWAMLFLFGHFIERRENCSLVTRQRSFYASFLVIFFLMPILLSTATSFYIAVLAVKARLAEQAATRMAGYGAGCTAVASDDEESNTILDTPNRKISKKTSRIGSVSSRSESVVPWRTITFVFTTTIWSTLTYLPYRISLFLSSVAPLWSGQWQWALFALMVIYVVGNPIITIVTQPNYRRRVTDVVRLIKNEAKNPGSSYTDV